MRSSSAAKRLEGLPTIEIGGLEVPVAVGLRVRLLGLAGLDLEQAGAGLLIPRCASVHTFGMRFALDIFFLDGAGTVLADRLDAGPRRHFSHRAAAAVLELPAGRGRSRPALF